MLMRTILTTLFAGLLLSFTGCKAPSYIPGPSQLASHVQGLPVQVHFMGSRTRRGELIAVTDDKLFALPYEGSDKSMQVISKSEVKRVHILVARTYDDLSKVGTLATINSVLFPLHGWWMVFTGPINWGISARESYSYYTIEYPDAIAWGALHQYARFPQGLPPNVALEDIR